MSRPTSARASALVGAALAAGILAVGAAEPARTAPPTIWSTAAAAGPVVRPVAARWPRPPARRYAMDTPAGDRAIRQIVLDASARPARRRAEASSTIWRIARSPAGLSIA